MARATRTVDLAAPAGELDHGADGFRDLGSLPGPVAVADRFRISQQPHASYEVVADGISGTLVPLRLERVSADESQVLQSATGAGAGSSRSLRWQNAGPTIVADQKIRVASNGCSTDCGFADVYHLRAYETTLAVPRFNNGGSQITVLVLQNPTAQPVAGTIYFWSVAGALLGSSPLALAPAAALVLNTASVPGVAGASGTVTVAHDAPYGALAGKTVAVEPATGFTFDAPLVVRTSGGGEPVAGLCESACGNAVAECGERCDGADLGAQTCVTLGFTSGALSCAASCRFDTSGCVP